MKRYAVVFVLFLLSVITYIDRVCISAAKDPVAESLHLSDASMGMVFSAFALGYALAQIPAGWFADRAGPKLALTCVVGVWSLLTALTGAAWDLTSLLAIRFLFGIGEAGAFPGSSRALYNWLPAGERGRAHGALFSGSRLGAAFSFPLLAWMLSRWEWRVSFLLLGVLGLAWAAFWAVWFRNHPEKPLPQTGEAAAAPLAIRDVFRSRPMALAMAQYFAGNFTFFICLSWMNPYLKKQYHLTDAEAAGYSMAPLLLGASAQWIGGWMADRLYRSRYRAWSRRIPGMLGFALAAAGVLAVTQASSELTAVACFTMAAFGADMTISPSWSFCADVAGRNSGGVSGAMNMCGNIGSFFSANAFPYLFGLTGSASAYFVTAALLNVMGLLCWYRMRPVHAVLQPAAG